MTFFILLVIIVFVYALLGNEIFAYRVFVDSNNAIVPANEGTPPRTNFNDFLQALVAIFIVLIGEDW